MATPNPTTYQRRSNRGQHRLLACTPCVECHRTIYPDAVTAYRVRIGQAWMGAPAFYYAHAIGQCEQAA